MRKIMYLLVFFVLGGCAGLGQLLDPVVGVPTVAVVGDGDAVELRKETQFFIDWWQDVIQELKIQAKQASGDQNTTLQTEEIAFFNSYGIIVVRIYVKYSDSEANFYAFVSNINHGYEILGMIPIQ